MWIAVGVVIIVIVLVLFFMQRDLLDRSSHVGEKKRYSDGSQKDIVVERSIFVDGIKKIYMQQPIFTQVTQELRKKIIGLDGFLHSLFISLLVPKGHVLIEGVPGLAKTKTISTLANILAVSFKRIQFTPDMLPGDLTGGDVFVSDKKQFEFVAGPLFAQMILADEINRTTPKVQSALLEAMEEQQITVGNSTYLLPKPFFVMATQNPLEQAGTYPLPEAQVDRFLIKILLDYPTAEQEEQMLVLVEEENKEINSLLDAHTIEIYQEEVAHVHVSDVLKQYIVRLVEATRNKKLFQYGASPRASLALMRTTKALAWLQGRNYVMHHDVQAMCLLVLRHRVALKYDLIASGKTVDEVLVDVLQRVSV